MVDQDQISRRYVAEGTEEALDVSHVQGPLLMARRSVPQVPQRRDELQG